MSTCKDCVHYKLCGVFGYVFPVESCGFYTDRSRFVELPCKLGNSVFSLNPNRTFHAIRVDGANVELITSQGFIFNQSLIGKTVFLTREEAERALKERET